MLRLATGTLSKKLKIPTCLFFARSEPMSLTPKSSDSLLVVSFGDPDPLFGFSNPTPDLFLLVFVEHVETYNHHKITTCCKTENYNNTWPFLVPPRLEIVFLPAKKSSSLAKGFGRYVCFCFALTASQCSLFRSIVVFQVY